MNPGELWGPRAARCASACSPPHDRRKSASRSSSASCSHARDSPVAFGNGVVMIGAVDRQSHYGRLIAQPDEIWGRQTQTIHVVTEDPDEMHGRAQAAGAEIVMPLDE